MVLVMIHTMRCDNVCMHVLCFDREAAGFVLRAPFPRTFIFSSAGIQVSDKELQNRFEEEEQYE